MSDWVLVIFAAGSAVMSCMASYQLGNWHGYQSRWVPPEPKLRVGHNAEHVEEDHIDPAAEFLLESVTVDQLVDVHTAAILMQEVLPELTKQSRLISRYRNRALRAKKE